ncbi:MAG: hypothetical protein WDM92_07275 [Caulobacteraceae bacterium]
MQDKIGDRVVMGLTLATALVLAPTFALAYVGPGLGMSAVASAFSLVGAILLGILGFIWYPIKRLIRAVKRPRGDVQ